MTPPAMLGEVWRTVLDGRDVVIVRYIAPHAMEWRDGEWRRMWDEDAAAVYRAWGGQMAAERDAARGVAQLAVEERDEARDFADVARADVAALRERLTRAEHAVVRCHAAELLSEGQAAKILAGAASDIDRIDLRDRVLAHEEALRAEGRADAEARTAVPPLREPSPGLLEGLRGLAASEAPREPPPADGYDVGDDVGLLAFGWGVGSRESGGEEER